MKTTIFFYSGTGNSLWTARNIARSLGDTELISIAQRKNEAIISSGAECIGIVFPVHMWGLPRPVIEFIQTLAADPAKYYFAVAVNAGQVAATLIQLKKLLQQKEIALSAGFSICLPSNYIPWGGAIPVKKQQELFASSLEKINSLSDTVRLREKRNPEKGPSWQNVFLSAFYKLGYPRIPSMDKSFRVDEKCTSCKICEKICPSRNIVISNGKPVWQHHCEQCLACIQWCPEEAIQYGKNTATKKRYHHPEIKLQDMLACVAPAEHKR